MDRARRPGCGMIEAIAVIAYAALALDAALALAYFLKR
jgi:hypothetical protein